jgi:hypothetical protein
MRNTKYNIVYYIIFFIVFFIVLQLIYSRATYFEKIITVKEKNSVNSGRYGKNIIKDSNGELYIISNSIYFWFFNSIELYTNIQVNSSYKIKGFGYKISSLGIFSQIVSANPINS